MQKLKKYEPFFYLLVFILVCGLLVITYLNQGKSKKIEIERRHIKQDIPTKDIPTIDFEVIRKKYDNNDIVGALRISNTDFEEIVFKRKDNNYYLLHNYRGQKSKTGELALDYRLDIDNSKVKIIYSNNKLEHNKDYYNKHQDFEIETEKAIYKYKLISVFDGNYAFKISFKDDEEYNSYINNLIDKSSIKVTDNTKDNPNLLILKDNNLNIIAKNVK